MCIASTFIELKSICNDSNKTNDREIIYESHELMIIYSVYFSSANSMFLLRSYDFSTFSLTFAQDLGFSLRPHSSIICIPFILFMYIFILDHDCDVDTSKVLGVTLSSSFS